jgi:hypothetical protein
MWWVVLRLCGPVLALNAGELTGDEIASHRPITLLNCEYRQLVAWALVKLFTPAAEAVVDPGQTTFLPGTWIGYNILQHLEVIYYNCKAEQLPGCIMFLYFEKAYDRMDRGWLTQCAPPCVVQRMGLPGQPKLRGGCS